MKRQTNFKTDLLIGQKYERFVQKLLTQNNNLSIKHENHTNKYDFKLSNDLTFEVKADSGTKKTGNMFIEFESRGKKSSISVSKSDFYVYVLPGIHKTIIIKTESFKDYIKESSPRIIGGGDKNTSKGWLVWLPHFLDNATNYKVVSAETPWYFKGPDKVLREEWIENIKEEIKAVIPQEKLF